MKKWTAGLGLIYLVILFIASPVYAEELKFSLGLRTWYNWWEIEPDGGASNTSDPAFLLGPNFKLSYGKFFGGMSYMTTVSDYRFPGSTWSRHDLDVIFGYMVHPRLGVVGGWKYLRGSQSTGPSHTAYGPALGLSFNYPLPIQDLGITFYLNAFFLPMKGEYKVPNIPDSPDYDITGFSAEAGFAYSPFQKFSINLGYKYQYLDWKNLANDILSGVTLGVSYEF
jgi:opacity protein-like surface antigen